MNGIKRGRGRARGGHGSGKGKCQMLLLGRGTWDSPSCSGIMEVQNAYMISASIFKVHQLEYCHFVICFIVDMEM